MNTECFFRVVRVFILAGVSASFSLGMAWAEQGNPAKRDSTVLTSLPLIGRPGDVPAVSGYSPAGTNLDGEGLKERLNPRTLQDLPKTPNGKNHSEIKCTVIKWEAQLPNPVLTLVCPPKLVFAPLYVYFRLSWAKPEDVPRDLQSLVVTPKSQTKVEPQRSSMRVWLKTQGADNEKNGGRWVEFNRVSIYHLEAD